MTPRCRTAGFLALPLLLAACGGGGDNIGAAQTTAPVTPRPPAATPSGYPSFTSEPTETSASSTVYAFGQTAEWEDGVQATVIRARKTTFGETATKPGAGIKVTIKVTAGSDAVELVPTVDVRLGTEASNAEEVYAEGCDGIADLGRVAAGRSVSGTLCFAGRAPTIDVSFAPTFDHNALTWSGKVG